MRKLQKFLQRQRGMAENGNTLAKCLQNKDLNKAVTKVFMLMVIFSFAEHARKQWITAFYPSEGILQKPVLAELLIENTPVNHGLQSRPQACS